MRKIRVFSVLAVFGLITLVGGQLSHAAISWNFDYSGHTAGIGFLDPVHGAARQAALAQAASQYGALFNHTATIDMKVTSFDNPADDTLASAGSEGSATATPGFGLGEVVRNKVQSGGVNDLNGTAADGVVNVNWGATWEISANAAGVDDNEFDFFSTIYHELNHALGFSSDMNQAGQDPFGDGNNGNAGSWSMFDKFIVDATGAPVINPSSYLLNQSSYDTGKIGGPVNGLFFNGTNAVAANGGNLVGLYTPNPYEDGSSVSHLDDQNSLYTGFMMLAATDMGPSARELSAIERAIYTDIGYDMNPIPIPSTLLLLASGFGLTGYIRRKRKA